MVLRLTAADFRRIAPRAPAKYADAFVRHQGQLDAFGITANANRYADFLANTMHECGEFHHMQESGDYRAERIPKVWPKRFSSVAAAAPYAHNAQKLFNKVYADRMGNGPPSSGDGYAYRGRGLAQVTGKDGYRNVGAVARVDLLRKPDMAMDAVWMNLIAGAFWGWKKLNRLSDAGNFDALVTRWNGGHVGIAERRAYRRKAREVCMGLSQQQVDALSNKDDQPQPAPEEPVDTTPVPLPRPDPRDDEEPVSEFDVSAAQRRLRALGYFPGDVDGDMGPLTRDALLSFQADNSLPLTGKVDAATWAELRVAGPRAMPPSRTNADAGTLAEKGSETISFATRIKRWAMSLFGIGVAGEAADNVSPVEKAKEYLGAASEWHGYLEPLQDVWQFAMGHKFMLLVGVGGALAFFATRIIKSRVEDERTGANRGR